MGRPLKRLSDLITGAIQRAKDKNDGDDSLVRDGDKIICNKCDEEVKFDRNTITGRINDHLSSKKHNGNKGKSPQMLLTHQVERMRVKQISESQFASDLLDFFMSNDIPLAKLPKMKPFFEKYCGDRIIPSVTSMRRALEQFSDNKVEKIREIVGNSDVYFEIDETDDSKSRNVVNVIVGTLNDKECKPMLLHVDFKSVTNADTIQLVVIECCKKLWPNDATYPRLVLILSDQASYMLKAGRELKDMKLIFPKLNHITCIVHAISLVCQSISKQYFLVNKFFANQKAWFKNSNKRKSEFKRKTKLSLIPFPIKIRWASWLKCANYHRLNFDKVRDYFMDIKMSNEPARLKTMKKILSGTKLGTDILDVTDKYGSIPSIITKLEGANLKRNAQLDLLESVKQLIAGTSHFQMLMSSLDKNPDFVKFNSDENSMSDRVKRTYAPLTTCNVERSFSIYRCLFRDNRTNLTTTNLGHMMVAKYNNFL